VLERAKLEDPRWPFAQGAIVKTAPTPKMVELGWRGRLDAASQLAPVLQVPDPGVVAGKNVLVYDDVFTTGTTLREVAFPVQASRRSARGHRRLGAAAQSRLEHRPPLAIPRRLEQAATAVLQAIAKDYDHLVRCLLVPCEMTCPSRRSMTRPSPPRR
jgi:hypothetical protein